MLIKLRNMLKPIQTKKGQSAVEFALIFPLLLLLVLGMVDFGRMFITYLAMSNGSREAARYGGVHWGDVANIRQKVINAGAQSLISIPSSSVSIVYLGPEGSGEDDEGSDASSRASEDATDASTPDYIASHPIIGCWPSASSSYIPVAADGTCGPTLCPRTTCGQVYPGDAIQITVTIPWTAQTLILKNILGSGYNLQTTNTMTIT